MRGGVLQARYYLHKESNLSSVRIQPMHLAASHLQMLSTRARIGGSQTRLKPAQVELSNYCMIMACSELGWGLMLYTGMLPF